MAFIGMFFSVIFFTVLIVLTAVSLIGLVTSIIIAAVYSKEKSKKNKIIKSAACVFICLSVVGMLPLIFITGASPVHSATVPEDFVDVEISAEFTEDGFVTSDGKEFKILPYSPENTEYGEACFAVKPKGFFKRCEWLNIYKFDADGKNLYIYYGSYYAEGVIYCEAECYDEVVNHFAENRLWQQRFGDEICSAEAAAVIEKYKAADGAAEYDIDFSECLENDVICLSNDGAVMLDECTFVKYNGKFYILTYHIIEDYYRYYGFELTAEEAVIAENEFFTYYENQ